MGVSATAVARVLGVETIFQDLRGGAVLKLPQRVALIGQGASTVTYATTPLTVTSAAEVGQTYGFGSPLHLAALQLLPVNGDGLGNIPLTIYPLQDDGSGAPSAGDITPTGTQTGTASYVVKISGISSAPFTIADGDVPADFRTAMIDAINAVLAMPMIAVAGTGDVTDLTAKWDGTASNECAISVEGPSNGITFGLTQPVGGLVNPDVTAATALISNIWETLIVNCMEFNDTTALDAFSEFGEGRWGALVRKPCVVFTGTRATIPSVASAVTDARKTQRTNAFITAPLSVSLACQIAARGVARIARQANDNPPVDYAPKRLEGIFPPVGAPGQWTYPQQDEAVKAGVSTSNQVDTVYELADTVTFYRPDGEEPPAYRYVVDIMKVMNIIFNLTVIFEAEEWNGAPLIPDDQATTNKAARKPKDAKGAVNAMIDSLALEAILSDPATAKKLTVAVIDGGNPKRLNVTLTVQVSGNSNIISVDLNFGFLFGVQSLAA